MEAKLWNIDTTHSGINFSVRHMVIAKVRGRFANFSGQLHFDGEDLTQARVDVEVDAASINTGVSDRDQHLRSPDFFDVERFDKLRFKSQRVEHIGGQRYRVYGTLTIRDVSREVPLEVDYAGQAKDPWGNTRAAFTATATLNRSDFGLNWNQVLEAGGVLVGERIDIELDVQAVQAAASAAA